jgi:hypothetical protein
VTTGRTDYVTGKRKVTVDVEKNDEKKWDDRKMRCVRLSESWNPGPETEVLKPRSWGPGSEIEVRRAAQG